MNKLREESGGISIFLAIVTLAVVILTGLLVDIARVSAAKNQTARALDLATLSVLAGYETDLKTEYGLYAVHMPIPDSGALGSYVNKNLGIPDGPSNGEIVGDMFGDMVGETVGGELGDAVGETIGDQVGNLFDARPPHEIELYQYRVEQLVMEPQMPLADIEALERQILEYMKFRAPAALATGVAALLSQARTAGKMADSTKIKLAIDRKLGEIGKLQQDLRDYLYGDIGTTRVRDRFVKNFNKNGVRRTLADKVLELYQDYTDAAKEHYEMELRRRSSRTSDPEASRAELALVNEAKSALREAWDALSGEETEAFLSANRSAVDCIQKIVQKSGEVRQLYDQFDASLANFEPDEAADPVVGALTDDVESGKSALMDADSAAGQIDILNGNITALSRAAEGMSALRSSVLNYVPPGGALSPDTLMQKMLPDLSSYRSDIPYNYQRAASSGGVPDPREFVNDRIRELLKTDTENEKRLSDIGIELSQLPSRTAGAAPPAGEPGGTDFDLYDTESLAAENSLDNMRSIGEVVGEAAADGVESIRNGLYVGEYVLSTFANAAKDPYRWGGVAASAKAKFFDAEVEYILHGNELQSRNIFWSKFQLILVRFALNIIHIISDSEKTELATTIATALTAWSAGILVPVVADLIIAAWSLKESVEDVQELFEGKRVAFLKQKGDWKTSIGISAGETQKTKEELCWSYSDYLRIFLLIEPRAQKLGRINDLIEINTQHAGRALKSAQLFCRLRSRLDVSVNYVFLTAAFMPPRFRTTDRRHILSAALARDLF
ncbi:MAG: DUF5702 domain-containing protein [Clostridiales bacterium]|nr:DUF5702 domain-containing protein [Clostridiales bacterium]